MSGFSPAPSKMKEPIPIDFDKDAAHLKRLERCAGNKEGSLEMVLSYHSWHFSDDKALYLAHSKCLKSQNSCVYHVKKDEESSIKYLCGDKWFIQQRVDLKPAKKD